MSNRNFVSKGRPNGVQSETRTMDPRLREDDKRADGTPACAGMTVVFALTPRPRAQAYALNRPGLPVVRAPRPHRALPAHFGRAPPDR